MEALVHAEIWVSNPEAYLGEEEDALVQAAEEDHRHRGEDRRRHQETEGRDAACRTE